MSTNNRWYEFEKNEQEIDAFFEKLGALYPNVPILTVIPPWSGEPNEKLAIRSKEIKSIIEKTVIKYPKIKTINAYTMPREPHKRGNSTHVRGLSSEKVCVPCAVNRSGMSIAKVSNTGRVSTKDLHEIYDGRIDPSATLVTDKMNSYVRFSNANGIELVQLKTGKAKKGIYNIQHINSYHSQLKRFMKSFNGVSTKYLNNYLIWHNFVNYAKESDVEKRAILLSYVLTTLKTDRNSSLSDRPALPLVA